MATINYYLDPRNPSPEGLLKLKILVANRGTKAVIPLPPKYSYKAEDWDASTQQVGRGVPDFRNVNRDLRNRIDDMCERMELKFGLAPTCKASVIARSLCDVRGEGEKTFLFVYEEYMGRVKKESSRKSYEYTLSTLKKHEPLLDQLTFDDIDKHWLDDLKEKLCKTLSINTVAIHLEAIRAVCNYAYNNDVCDKYAFKGYTIERHYEKKPIIHFDDIKAFINYKVYLKAQQYFLDYWKISFGLCGINFADLYKLKDSQVVNGRLEYDRQKTGVHVSVRIEPEVWELINAHKGKRGMLLDLSEKWKDHKSFFLRMNRSIKKWGPWHREGRKIVVESHPWEFVTSYTARREWCSIAAELDIPERVIAMGVGHADGTMASKHYITMNDKKLDAANRMVLRYVGMVSEDEYIDRSVFKGTEPLSDLLKGILANIIGGNKIVSTDCQDPNIQLLRQLVGMQ